MHDQQQLVTLAGHKPKLSLAGLVDPDQTTNNNPAAAAAALSAALPAASTLATAARTRRRSVCQIQNTSASVLGRATADFKRKSKCE